MSGQEFSVSSLSTTHAHDTSSLLQCETITLAQIVRDEIYDVLTKDPVNYFVVEDLKTLSYLIDKGAKLANEEILVSTMVLFLSLLCAWHSS